MKKPDYVRMMNKSLKGMFIEAFRISFRNPPLAGFIIGTVLYQKKAAAIRRGLEAQGIHIPPYLIASITGRCNLRCKGCYAMAKGLQQGKEMGMDRIREIVGEALELGISIIILAGGEPLLRSEILDITGDFPKIIFPLFTNGTLLNDETLGKIKRQRNVVPVISMEGYEEDTDGRRGEGIHHAIAVLMERLKRKGMFYGTSVTVTRSNFKTVTDVDFIGGLVSSGCKLFFFVEYVPVREGTENWTLTEEQRNRLSDASKELRKRFRALFIAFPGDEEEYGGCLSSGRGFVHISPAGGLEPCPFAPYSDASLASITLKDALKSRFLNAIRQEHKQLEETKGGCALWEKKEWVQSLLAVQKKYDEEIKT